MSARLTNATARLRWQLAALLTCLLSGCALWRPAPDPSRELPLLAPAALQQSWQKLQRVTLQTQGADDAPMTLLMGWSVDADQLNAVVLVPGGQTLFRLSYDGQTLQEDYSELIPVQLRRVLSGRDILAQLQLAYWPEAVIEQQLRGTPWIWENLGSEHRLRRDCRVVLEMQSLTDSPSAEQLRIIHRDSGLILEIETLNHTPITSTRATGAEHR